MFSFVKPARHFKTRSFGEVYYPIGGRSGRAYIVESPEKSAQLRRRLTLIRWLEPVWTVLLYVVGAPFVEGFLGGLGLLFMASYAAEAISFGSRHLIARGLPLYESGIDETYA